MTADELRAYKALKQRERRERLRRGERARYHREPAIPLSALKRDVRRVARLIGRRPTQTDYERHGQYSPETVRNRLGGSWRAAIEACGLRYQLAHPEHPGGIPTDDELRRDLDRVRDQLGRPPNWSEYQEHGRYYPPTLARRANGRRWKDALIYFLHLEPDEAGRYSTHDPARYRTTAERLDELRALAKRLRHSPTEMEARAHGIACHSLRARTGEGWLGILALAKLPPPASVNSLRASRGLHGATRKQAARPATPDEPRHLGEVADPARDLLKDASTEAIKEFFKRKK